MLEPGNWHDDAYGQLSATAHNLKLIIRKFDGCVRFLVIRSAEGERRGDIMLASGTESTVTAAMITAERTARRMSKSLFLR